MCPPTPGLPSQPLPRHGPVAANTLLEVLVYGVSSAVMVITLGITLMIKAVRLMTVTTTTHYLSSVIGHGRSLYFQEDGHSSSSSSEQWFTPLSGKLSGLMLVCHS